MTLTFDLHCFVV